jgi:integrase/recombinase XerD
MSHKVLARRFGLVYRPDMPSDSHELTVLKKSGDLAVAILPRLIADAHPAAAFVWDEFFGAMIRNRHTREAYLRAVRQFLAWVETQETSLDRITPGLVGRYFDQSACSLPTKKLRLAAIRAFFDALVNRHVVVLNPAATVRGERYQAIEGKTPEITPGQARTLLKSIDASRPVGRRDKAIVATLIYTAGRAGAIANLRLRDLTWDGTQYALRFAEKGGKSRLIPVRHDLQAILLAYLESFDWRSEPREAPFFRAVLGRTGSLAGQPIRNIDICRMVKRRLRDAGLPGHFSPHSFRVATATDLLLNGIPLEDVQYLLGHADPRTTRLYDRRQKQVTRNTVERISI